MNIFGFEYDPLKSQRNAIKHGIDFIEARKIWHDEDHLDMESKYPNEDRFLIIGKINHKLWTAIVTYRLFRIRIISVRRSRKDEQEAYNSRRAG